MEEMVVVRTTEFSEAIAATVSEFYRQAAAQPAATRLAQLQERAWDVVMSGACARAAFEDLHRQAERLLNADEVIDACNQQVIWALTPVVAASLACAPGEDPIRLREIAGALSHLLDSALSDAGAPDQRAAA